MIHLSQPDIGLRERTYVSNALAREQLSGGDYVSQLESVWANLCHTKYAVACNSGTAALHLTMLAAGIQPGQGVIVPATTYIATANAVAYCGGTVQIADVDPDTWTLTPETAMPAADQHTVAAVAVHLYGQPAAMILLQNMSAAMGWFLIEDAAEAHGAFITDGSVGGLADMGVFSFYGNKIIAAGEGGMVVTSDDGLYNFLQLYRGQAANLTPAGHYWHSEVGYNYRMPELTAAVAMAQTERLPELLAKRQAVAAWYQECLPDVRGTWERQGGAVHWLAVTLLPSQTAREAVARRLRNAGIETRPVFPPLHWQPPYRNERLHLPVAEDLYCRGLCLPLHTGLTRADVERIGEVINAWRA